MLWDYDPVTNTARRITRGSWQARDGGDERRVEYQLSPQLYTIPAGHVLEARVKFGMSNILGVKPDDEFGKVPYRPSVGSTTTLTGTVEEPAYVRMLTPDDVSSVAGMEEDGKGLSIRRRLIHSEEGIDVAVKEAGVELQGKVELIDMRGVYGGSMRFGYSSF